MANSHLEDQFEMQLQNNLIVGWTRECKAVPGRRYRWDFAFSEQRLLVEIQGAIFVRGGHSTGIGITRDAEKLNCATMHGWHSLIFTGEHIQSGEAIKLVFEYLTNFVK